ncbi:hypothetical protein GQ457_12G012700 [Hibiscus cannabinus]
MIVILDKGKSQSVQHPYGTQRKKKMMNEDRLKKIEQDQKDLQADLTKKMEDQLTKVQQDMREHIMKSQQDMLGQLAQILGIQLPEKGEASVMNPPAKPTNESEGPTYPPGFTPMMQPENQPQVIISRGKTPLDQATTYVPVNVPFALKDLPGENQAENFLSGMDELLEGENLKFETSKEIEDRASD